MPPNVPDAGYSEGRILIAGAGLAGMAAAAALVSAGFRVTLFEAKGHLGGRACSYPLEPGKDASPVIDNSQHILLGCCVNLMDFYRRLGVAAKIRFFREYSFIEPGGRVSVLKPGRLPAPWSLAASFSRLRFLSLASKWAVARALAAIRREYGRDSNLDAITMDAWLRQNSQPDEAIARFWRPVIVSAVNAAPEAVSAAAGLKIFRLAFLGEPQNYELGVPSVPLGELYQLRTLEGASRIELRLRARVDRVALAAGRAIGFISGGELHPADACILALPFEQILKVAPELGIDASRFRHSPITGIHLWFDQPPAILPHAALLDRTIQWFFSKNGGRYVQLVVSASHALTHLLRNDVIALALRELSEFFPAASRAKPLRAHVVKELRATFEPAPGLEAARPESRTGIDGLFLAGDWTRTGWPATMEGAVRSGYLAAEAVLARLGAPRRFLLPDPV